MKHQFLLDENILFLAIKGVDEHDSSDSTCADLLRLIRINCHAIVLNPSLLGKYYSHLQSLQSVRSPYMAPVAFIRDFLNNSEKRHLKISV